MTEIFTARSVDEAKELAAKKFGRKISEIRFEIVDEGKKGLFGLGAKEAKVRATVEDAVKAAVGADVVASASATKKAWGYTLLDVKGSANVDAVKAVAGVVGVRVI